MKRLLLSLILFFPTALAAQELHTFSNGEVADAEKINQNFEALKSEISGSGGCSAEQDGSSVVITCPDGTTGVLASEGTVVVYPSGQAPIVDLSEIKTGDFIVVDSAGTVLAPLRQKSSDSIYEVYVQSAYGEDLRAYLAAITAEEVVQLRGINSFVYFNEEDCKGQPFTSNTSYLYNAPGGSFVARSPQTSRVSQILKSRYGSGFSETSQEIYEICENEEIISSNTYLLFPYLPSPEILNAVYPIPMADA